MIDWIGILIIYAVVQAWALFLIWLWNEIEFRLWWRKWKRFIDKGYGEGDI